jgi:hypothetical protein
VDAVPSGPLDSMGQDKPERRQMTQPKKGKPIDIPVPKRDEIDRLLKKASKPRKAKES